MSLNKFSTTARSLGTEGLSQTKFEHPELMVNFNNIRYEVLIKEMQRQQATLSTEILNAYHAVSIL
jgi:hypothetical protein